MDKIEEAKFKKRCERHFRGHQPVPNGMNLEFWNMKSTSELRNKYYSNFDKIFNPSERRKTDNSSVDTTVNIGEQHE